MERIALVDGSNLIYRAFFALPQSLTRSDGTPVNAVFGFAQMFKKIFAGRLPALGVVLFDAPDGGQKREAEFADYKGTREAMPRELKVQLPLVEALCRAQGFQVLQVPGVEADDVIGTLARLAKDAGHDVQIISSDKDFAQLIDDRCRLIDTLRDAVFDAETARKKWGIRPDQMIDYLALLGDAVDNVPGVPGIGAKTAVALLEAFPDLDAIYAALDQGDATALSASPLRGRTLKTLQENRELAFLSRRLVTIDQAVDLPVTLDDLRVRPVDLTALHALYRDLEFFSLLGEAPPAPDAPTLDSARLTTHAEVQAFLAALPSASPVAIAAITRDASIRAPLIGLALSARPNEARYFPFRGQGPLLTPDARDALSAWLCDPTHLKFSHESKSLWRALRLEFPPLALAGVCFDTQLASFLIDPARAIPHRLDQLTKERLQRPLEPEKTVLGSGQKLITFDLAEPAALNAWACERAEATLALYPSLHADLAAEDQARQLHERDLPLAWVLGQLELDGILVDRANLDALSVEFTARLATYEREIWELSGREFNIASPKQLGELLFDELKLPIVKRTKTGYSTDSEVLEALAPLHPIARLVVEYRRLAKLINTYTLTLAAAVDPETNRIHATYAQTASATGRLATSAPSIQQTPIHTPEGRRIREAFIAPPGHQLIVADWSQIELRLLADVTRDPHLIEAFQLGQDIHRRTAGQIFNVPLDAVTSEQRNIGKTINFATIYGQGATSLAQMLGLERAQAKRYIDSYFAYYAGVRAWLDQTAAEATQRGWVRIPGPDGFPGRKRIIPELTSNASMLRQMGIRMACNTPIQGAAADLCKSVMLAIPQAFLTSGLHARMLLQVHDELVFEAPDAEVDATARLVKALMEAPPGHHLHVPLVADVGIGSSWAAAKG